MAPPKLVGQCLTGGKGRGGGKAHPVEMDEYTIYKTGKDFKRYMAHGSSKKCSHNLTRILSKDDAEKLAAANGQKSITNWVPKKKK